MYDTEPCFIKPFIYGTYTRNLCTIARVYFREFETNICPNTNNYFSSVQEILSKGQIFNFTPELAQPKVWSPI